MSNRRRTVKIEELKATANDCFRNSENEFREGRKAIKTFVEDILFQSNQYKGFRYLEQHDLEVGKTLGLIRDAVPVTTTNPSGHLFPDDSRVAFL